MAGEPTVTPRGWHRPAEAGLVTLLVAASTSVFVSHGFLGRLDRDLAVYVYAGQRVAEGVPPYVGIVNRAGPLAHLLPGIAIWAGRHLGVSDVMAARLLYLAFSVVAVYAAYRLGRVLLGSAWLGTAVAASLVSVHGFVEFTTRGPREKTVMVLLTLVLMECVVRRRWLLAGGALGLATLTWQPVLLPGLAVALVALALEDHGRRLRGLVRFAVGGLVPLLAFVASYAVIGRLQDFVDCFVLVNLRYTRTFSVFHDLARNRERLVEGFGVSLWVLGVGLLAVLAGAAVAAARLGRRRDERRAVDASLVALGVGGLVALLWTIRSFNNSPDALVLAPFAVAGVAVLLDALRAAGGVKVAAVAAAVTTVTAFVVGARYATSSREDGYDAQRRRAEGVMAVLGPDATMLSIQAPAPLVVTRSVNPVRHQMFGLGLGDYVQHTWPGGVDGLRASLLARHPTVVVAQAAHRPRWVKRLLAAGYVRSGYDPDGRYTYYISTAVPPELQQEARHVVRSTR